MSNYDNPLTIDNFDTLLGNCVDFVEHNEKKDNVLRLFDEINENYTDKDLKDNIVKELAYSAVCVIPDHLRVDSYFSKYYWRLISSYVHRHVLGDAILKHPFLLRLENKFLEFIKEMPVKIDFVDQIVSATEKAYNDFTLSNTLPILNHSYLWMIILSNQLATDADAEVFSSNVMNSKHRSRFKDVLKDLPWYLVKKLPKKGSAILKAVAEHYEQQHREVLIAFFGHDNIKF